MTLRCCRIVRKGRYTVAEPWFSQGHQLALAEPSRWNDSVGHLAIVEIPVYGPGRVLEVIGDHQDVRAVMRGLLAEQGLLGSPPVGKRGGRWIPGTEPDAVRDEIAQLPCEIPHLQTRRDLRSQPCITIDPVGAQDHDDAIWVGAASDIGHPEAVWELWVHIADVSAYVRSGTALDEYARERAMSAYVPGTVAPMLPHELSSDLCSLLPGQDRGCVSLRALVDKDGATVVRSFHRTLIRSARKLTYEEVDHVLLGGASVDAVTDAMLEMLNELTAVLNARRVKSGALEIGSTDTEIVVESDRVVGAYPAEQSPSHRLVEECMLLTNNEAGALLARSDAGGRDLPALWRVHPHPDPVGVEQLIKLLTILEIPTPPVPEDMTPQQASQLAGTIAAMIRQYSAASGRGRFAFLPRVLRTLQQARYAPASDVHSGLATQSYAHFTSPIRRYPDLINHRSLLVRIGADDDASLPRDAPSPEQLGQHVSEVERDLLTLERMADRVALSMLAYDLLYVPAARETAEKHGMQVGEFANGVFRGEVVGMISSGIFVRFCEVFEGFLPARTLDQQQRFDLDDYGIAMVGGRSGERIQIGDTIDISVESVDRPAGRISLRRVSDTLRRR